IGRAASRSPCECARRARREPAPDGLRSNVGGATVAPPVPTVDRRALSALARSYPRQYWLMVAGMVISNAGGSLVWPFLLIFASGRLDLPLAAVGSLITIQAGAGMLASFVAGTLADRLGRKVVMFVSLASNGVIYLFLLNASGYAEFAV